MSDRLVTSKVQFNSVELQFNEAFAVRKIEGSIHVCAGVMSDVDLLIRLPELAGTMRELSKELMKAGIIEEMVGENLPDDKLAKFEEAAAEEEVDNVKGNPQGRMAATGKLSTALTAPELVATVS